MTKADNRRCKEMNHGKCSTRTTRRKQYQGQYTESKQYQYISNEQRRRLIDHIHTYKLSISKASKIVGIPYENAKVINAIYVKEGRTDRQIALAVDS